MIVLGVIGFGTWLISVLATWAVLGYLRRRQIMDMPNERSSHSLPTPRGGGLAVTPIVLLGCLGIFSIGGMPPVSYLVVIGGSALLALISWIDDRRGLSPLPRFAAQILVAAIGVSQLSGPVFQGLLPATLDMVAAVLLWVWFINLFNFMDGIDGITGVQTAALGAGLLLAGLSFGLTPLGVVGLVSAAAALGFLFWNWHPAKLFLGDVGSIPLGCLLGFSLLELAASGYWVTALILPGYYLADATITLGRRALRGEKIWKPHRSHFYQQATGRGWRHDRVVIWVAAANIGLLIAAFADGVAEPVRFAAALSIIAVLLGLMAWRPAPLLDSGDRDADKGDV